MPKLTRREMVAAALAGAAVTSIESVAAPGEALASAKATLPLYPGKIPGALDAPDEEAIRDPKEPWVFRQNISRPTLTLLLPAQAKAGTPAVVICPGGSYRGVSIDKEGYSVAQAFNRFGVAGIVLKYRTPSPRHMQQTWTGPLQDAQQAMSVVRNRASEWNIDPERVGIVGFSAGGHLAASASTMFHGALAAHAGESASEVLGARLSGHQHAGRARACRVARAIARRLCLGGDEGTVLHGSRDHGHDAADLAHSRRR